MVLQKNCRSFPYVIGNELLHYTQILNRNAKHLNKLKVKMWYIC